MNIKVFDKDELLEILLSYEEYVIRCCAEDGCEPACLNEFIQNDMVSILEDVLATGATGPFKVWCDEFLRKIEEEA